MIIYLCTNLINNKQYVGYTTFTLEKRKKEHLYKSKYKADKHYFYLLPVAIRKYGFENFQWKVLFETNDINEAQEKEKYYIKELNTLPPYGYNLTKGGNGGTPSDKTKIKISNSLKKYYTENNNHPWKTLTIEKRKDWARKASITKKANGYTQKADGYIQKGMLHSDKSKEKMSKTKNEKNKLKWINKNTKEIIELSPTEMAKYTHLSIGTFNHLKQGRIKITKTGWCLYCENDKI